MRYACWSWLPAAVWLYLAAAAPAQTADTLAAERQYRQCTRDHPDSVDCVVHHAGALARIGQPYDGILELETFIAQHPSAVPAVELYAEMLEKFARDFRGAEQALEKAAALVPGDVSLWRSLGGLYAAGQQTADALRCYTRALGLLRDDPQLIAGLAYCYGQNGEEQRARQEFSRAIALNQKQKQPSAEVLALYGGFLRNSGHAAESIPQLTAALRLNPRLWRVYYERALAYESTGDLARAEIDALAALKAAGDRRDIRILLTRIYRSRKDFAKVAEQMAAIEKLNQAEDRYYTNAREMRESLNAAEAAVTRGDCAAAIAPYERVVALMPAFYEAWFPLGVCYQHLGRRQEAEKAFLTYLNFQPLSADGHAALGLLYFAMNRPADARPQLEQAIDIDPSSTEAAFALAQIQMQARDYRAAAAIAGKLAEDAGAGAEVFALAANASAALGERGKALEYCRRALARWPDDESLQRSYAGILSNCLYADACRADLVRALDQHPASLVYRKAAAHAMVLVNPWDEETARMVRELVAQNPRDPGAVLMEAAWQERRNQPAAAMAVANRALELASPDDPLRIQALAILARSYDAAGDAPHARQSFAQAWDLDLRLGLPDPAVAVSWADFLARQEDAPAAAQVLDELLRRAPGYAPALLARARLHAKARQEKAAIGEAARVLDSTDDPSLLQQAHALLARLYAQMGENDLARRHEDWIRANP